MSDDRRYLCLDSNSNNWRSDRQLTLEERKAFDREAEALYKRGNFVRLSAGRNCMYDELFIFDRAEDAAAFYSEGFRAFELIVDGVAQGFQSVVLFKSGRKIASKSDDPDVMVQGEVGP